MSDGTRLLMTVDAVGGVWTYALDLAAALAPLGYHTTLALLGPEPEEEQRRAVAAVPGARLIGTGLPLDWLSPDASSLAAAAAALAAIARRERADIVQLNQPAFAAAAAFPVPVLAVAHSCVGTWWQSVREGPLPPDLAWQADAFAAGIEAADALLCPSRAFADALAARYRLARSPEVVHNGRTPPPRADGALHDFALTAGRLWDAGKDVATLDRAAARLGVSFKAAGPLSGPHGETIRLDHLDALGSLGTAQLADGLAARPVFVSAARYEPFGLAVLEAAQAGCPLVLADMPTFRELWDEVALFVAPGDADGFAAAIERLIGDTELRLSHGDLARRRAMRFTAAAMAANTAAVHRRLIDGVQGHGRRAAA